MAKHAPLALELPEAPYENGSQLNKIAHAITAMETSQQKENVRDYTPGTEALQAAGLKPVEQDGVRGVESVASRGSHRDG
jgi:hypothetical protein